MKKKATFRLSEEVFNMLEEYSNRTGKSKTDIVEQAIKLLIENETHTDKQIELYQKENEQLRLALKVFQERERAIEEVRNTYQLLLKEKDERIKELKERLESKPFWKLW